MERGVQSQIRSCRQALWTWRIWPTAGSLYGYDWLSSMRAWSRIDCCKSGALDRTTSDTSIIRQNQHSQLPGRLVDWWPIAGLSGSQSHSHRTWCGRMVCFSGQDTICPRRRSVAVVQAPVGVARKTDVRLPQWKLLESIDSSDADSFKRQDWGYAHGVRQLLRDKGLAESRKEALPRAQRHDQRSCASGTITHI